VTQFKGRREDDRLLTGRGRYTADWNLPGQLYGHFLRSDRAHARIVSLKKEIQNATVFTGEDMAHLKAPPMLVKFFSGAAKPSRCPIGPPSAQDRVRFVGEAVALVVAESPQAAQDAAEAIEIEYEDLPAVVSEKEALEASAPLLHDAIPGNLAFDYDYGDEKAVADALRARGHASCALRFDSTRVSGNPMEPGPARRRGMRQTAATTSIPARRACR